MPKTLFDKLWDAHVVVPETADAPAVLYIDLHLVHEVTSPQAFTELKQRGLPVRRTDRTLATLDHSTPTLPAGPDGELPYYTAEAKSQVETLRRNAAEFGVRLYDFGSGHRGVVHVIGPELGATQPGMTIVCGDSHTSTHGAFGAIAFGIGTSEVGHVLASQCLLQRKPKRMAIEVEGVLAAGVSAKDVILHIIKTIGVEGGTGYAIEYRGSAIRGLDMEGRMTLCNMSIEAGARCGMVAPDEITFDYLRGRPLAPKGADFDAAVTRWRALATDEGAEFDRVVTIDAADIKPTVTWGTHPGWAQRSMRACPPAKTRSSPRRAPTWVSTPTRRCSAIRWTWCSSAAAPTAACPICAPPRRCCAGARSTRVCACWWCRAPKRSRRTLRPRAWTRSSARPAESGASPAARCASR